MLFSIFPLFIRPSYKYIGPTTGEVLTSEGYVITIPAATTARPIVTPPPYVPPQTQRPYVPPQTQRPYVPPAVQTTRPTTRPPFRGDEYIPPHVGEPSNPTNNYLPPEKVPIYQDEKNEPIIPGDSTNNNPSVIRPTGPTAPPPLPPIQCPAATNCTEIQFCTSEGTISKTPVILTKDQETYRVPLSECRDAVRGFTGRCCRDLDYTDPWPTSILGQYNATILGFDDGSYKPESAPARLTQPVQRGQGQLSLPIPAATQQAYTRTPFLQGVNSQYSKSPYTPEPNSISQREKPAINKYQPTPQQSNNNRLQQSKQYLQPYQPAQPQQKPQQQPITHRHVQRQSEPVQIYQPIQPEQPEQPAFFQPIVAQEPTPSQPQIPYGQQRYTANPSNNGVCAARDTVSFR